MKTKLKIITGLLLVSLSAFSQGFINLNFEQAQFLKDAGGAYPFSVYASNAIPGWTPYASGIPQVDVWSNGLSLGSAAVSIEGTNSGFPSIQGKFFILLQGEGVNFGGNSFITNSAAIGQTGQLPMTAQSLIFWGQSSSVGGPNTGIQITFNGQMLPFAALGSTANYNIYGADISAYAGQTGQLLFTAPYNTSGYIDNIQFSTTPVPEPGELALAFVGGLLLVWRRQKPFRS